MKKTLMLVFLLIILITFTDARELKQHIIEINIEETGNGKIIEKYILIFTDQNELEAFREAAQDNGASLLNWEVYDSNIATHVGNNTEIKNATVSFEELGDTRFISVSYELNNIATQTNENSRATEWKLNERIFTKLETGGIYIIPNQTIITIGLPPTATIQGQIVPKAIETGNRRNWNGYLTSNQLILNYKINKPIAQIDGEAVIQNLTTSPIFLGIGTATIILIIIATIKRKTISEKIENYIVERSRIEPTEETEDLEIE